MVADSLVYHPTVAHYIRFVSSTGNSPVPPVSPPHNGRAILTEPPRHSRP